MLFFLLFGFFTNLAAAQDVEHFIGERKITNYEATLSTIFTDYDVYELNSTNIANYVRNVEGSSMLLNLELGEKYNWNLLMYENELINENYSLSEKTNTAIKKSSHRNFRTLSGYVQTAQGGTAGLTINDHFILGMIHEGTQSYFIEPLRGIIQDAPQDLFVVYNTANIVPETGISCGVTDVAKYKVSDQQKSQGASSRMDECSDLELGLAADRDMFDTYGSIVAVENYLIGIWNLVAPDYTGWFSQDIEFNIVSLFVVSGQDPWVSTTDASELLSDFRTWGNNNGFGVGFDLGQLWTDRNIAYDGSNSTVGLAYVGVVCTNSKYSLIEDFSNNSNSMRQTVTHEVGHNFDATHDANGSSDIMAPTVNGSSSWSTNSVTDISAHINSRTCFEDCLQCLEVLSAEVQNCASGTYDLEICIEHVDRTNQSNLQITVNGSASSFSFSDTGQQCETITGLTANATSNATITVEDTNDNDATCTKTFDYTVPFPDCPCSTIFFENFDNLSLPTGWTNVGTGNNANGDWAFGNATNGDNTPAGSFDGSGMAYWDDDANGATGNGSEFMELTTPEVDLTIYETVTLDFDYNFWTFDGDDQFLVDVWNGNTWVNLLSSNTTDCGAWGCDYPHFSMSIDNYNNPAFKVRFTYDDSSNTWQWHVGIDNVEICGYELSALPIELISFEGADKECTIELEWEIAADASNDIFEVERSLDGQNFEVIGTINGLPSPNKVYNFIDRNPNFENFYRLKTTEVSGEINYSTIKSVTAKSCKEGVMDIVELFPNPTKADLFYNIHSNEASDVIVEIRNAAGMLVDKRNLQLTIGMNHHTFETNHLAQGMYFMQLTSDYGNSTVKKFVKE